MTDSRDSIRRQNSRVRGEKSLGVILGATLQEGASLVIPGGGLSVKGIGALVNHAKTFAQDRARERMTDFAQAVLEGPEDEEERRQLLDRELDPADFHAVLTALVNDQEDEKTALYACALRSLILGKVPKTYRRYVVRTISALSHAELELARRVYIHHHHDFPTFNAFPADRLQQVAELLQVGDTLQKMAVRSLVSNHLLAEPLTGAATFTMEGPASPRPTAVLDIVVTTTYPPAELTPESIGRRQRSPLANARGVFFATILEDRAAAATLSKLSGMLFDKEIQNSIVNPAADPHDPEPLLRVASVVAVCISPSGSPIEGVRNKARLDVQDVAVVLLPGAADDTSIERLYTLDLLDNDLSKVPAFITWVEQRIRLAATRRAQVRRARESAASQPLGHPAAGGSVGPDA